ncbi:MAG: GNAT family N-acetyltransferase, partial [Mycobacteriaceae bacterium]
TGEMLAEVGLGNIEHTERTAEIACWTAPTHRNKGIMATAAAAVVRLALAPEMMGGLGLHRVCYLHVDGNTAAAALAQRCGMVAEGRLREAVLIDGARRDMMLLARLATD